MVTRGRTGVRASDWRAQRILNALPTGPFTLSNGFQGHLFALAHGRGRSRVYAPVMFGVAPRVKAVKHRTQALVQLNLELAKLEGKQKATAVGIAAGLGAVAGVLIVYAVGFVFAAIAAATQRNPGALAVAAHRGGDPLLVAAIAGLLAMRFAARHRLRCRRRHSRGNAHGRDAAEPCLRSAAPKRSAERSPRSENGLDADLDALKAELARWCRSSEPLSPSSRS